MKNQENKIAANKRLAELLGWTKIAEVNGALVGTPPAGAAESRGQALVPDWMGEWSAAGPLLAQFEIRLTPASTCVDAGGFLARYRCYPDRDAAARGDRDGGHASPGACTMIAVTLPWPSAKLNPNRSKGLHWGATSALRKQARDGAMLLTKSAMQGQAVSAGAIALTITFIQPDRRARDRDNLLAALKPSLDGVADALGVNDARFDPVTLRREYGAKPGAVRIEIGGAS